MIEFRYDTQLLIDGENLDEDEINDYITEHFEGDCLLVVGDDTLKVIDVKDILIETDAPYLAPTPFRGQRNEPKYTNLVLDKIAEIKVMNKKELEQQILDNTIKTFGRCKI